MPQLDRIAPIEKAVEAQYDVDFGPSRGLYVGVTGNVRATFASGHQVDLVGLAGGVVHPLRIIRISTVGTTATNILVMN